MVVADATASTELAGSGRAEVTFRSDVETLVLVAYGRLTLEEARPTNHLTPEGEAQLAHQFQSWFPRL